MNRRQRLDRLQEVKGELRAALVMAQLEMRAGVGDLPESYEKLRRLEEESNALAHALAREDIQAAQTVGERFVRSEAFASYLKGGKKGVTASVKAATTSFDASGNARAVPVRAGRAGGAWVWRPTLEPLLPVYSAPSSSVAFTRVVSATNNAAELDERQGAPNGPADAPESDVVTTLEHAPVVTVAHHLKVSRELVNDADALAKFIDRTLMEGVGQRVERRIIAGSGVNPSMKGVFATGHYVPHGYSAAAIGATNPKHELIRRVLEDLESSDSPADAVILNPVDWSVIERTRATSGDYVGGGLSAPPRLWGKPVISSPGMPAGSFVAGAFGGALELYENEEVVVRLSESDDDNFTKGLVTVLAARRIALAVCRPGMLRGGSLSPA